MKLLISTKLCTCVHLCIHNFSCIIIYPYVCSLYVATSICFNESSVSVVEGDKSLIFTLNLSNPAAFDLAITVTPMYIEGAAVGEHKFILTAYITKYVCIYVYIYMSKYVLTHYLNSTILRLLSLLLHKSIKSL